MLLSDEIIRRCNGRRTKSRNYQPYYGRYFVEESKIKYIKTCLYNGSCGIEQHIDILNNVHLREKCFKAQLSQGLARDKELSHERLKESFCRSKIDLKGIRLQCRPQGIFRVNIFQVCSYAVHVITSRSHSHETVNFPCRLWPPCQSALATCCNFQLGPDLTLALSPNKYIWNFTKTFQHPSTTHLDVQVFISMQFSEVRFLKMRALYASSKINDFELFAKEKASFSVREN